MNPTLEKELQKHLDSLAPERQRQVVDFARALAESGPVVRPGKALCKFAGSISADDLASITRAIEEGCERVHTDDW